MTWFEMSCDVLPIMKAIFASPPAWKIFTPCR